MKVKELKDIASQVRRDIVRQVHSCQSGHPGGSLGCTDVVVSLYFEIMKINEEKGNDGFLKFSREGINEDLFGYREIQLKYSDDTIKVWVFYKR